MNKGYVYIGGLLLVICLAGFFLLGSPEKKSTSSFSVDIAPGEEILVATKNIQAGEFLEETDFKWISLETNLSDPSLYFLESKSNVEDLYGAVVSTAIARGEAFEREKVVTKNQSAFLTSVLASDKRAYTITVSTANASAGLIRPGNTVDVILIPHPRRQVDGTMAGGDSAQTILTNVPVIAVDKDFSHTRASSNDGDSKRRTEGTVTLEVAPKQVELLAVGQNTGVLSLSLINIHEAKKEISVNSNEVTRASEIFGEVQKDTPVKSYYGEQKK